MKLSLEKKFTYKHVMFLKDKACQKYVDPDFYKRLIVLVSPKRFIELNEDYSKNHMPRDYSSGSIRCSVINGIRIKETLDLLDEDVVLTQEIL